MNFFITFLIVFSALLHAGELAPRTIPDYCRHPDGSSCDFYEECVAAAYPQCTGGRFDYAMGYGHKFCTKFNDNLMNFTTAGQTWINDVRKCLEIALADTAIEAYLNGNPMTCRQIQDTAFASHAPCYLEPQPEADGVCQLPMSDFKLIIKVTLEAASDAFRQYVLQIIETVQGCLVQWG